jgi:hypothetical protein
MEGKSSCHFHESAQYWPGTEHNLKSPQLGWLVYGPMFAKMQSSRANHSTMVIGEMNDKGTE